MREIRGPAHAARHRHDACRASIWRVSASARLRRAMRACSARRRTVRCSPRPPGGALRCRTGRSHRLTRFPCALWSSAARSRPRPASRLATCGRTPVRSRNVGRCSRRGVSQCRLGRLGQFQASHLAGRRCTFRGEVGVLLDQALRADGTWAGRAWHSKSSAGDWEGRRTAVHRSRRRCRANLRRRLDDVCSITHIAHFGEPRQALQCSCRAFIARATAWTRAGRPGDADTAHAEHAGQELMRHAKAVELGTVLAQCVAAWAVPNAPQRTACRPTDSAGRRA